MAHRDGSLPRANSVAIGAKRTSAVCRARLARALLTDAVEKGFFSSGRARLIQDRAPARIFESTNHFYRFDRFVFLFHSFGAVTFSTASTHSGHCRAQILHRSLRRCRRCLRSRTVNTDPLPGSLVTVMLPPIMASLPSSTNARHAGYLSTRQGRVRRDNAEGCRRRRSRPRAPPRG